MKNVTVYPAGITDSCQYAARFLKDSNIALIDHISPEITHLLLDIPSFSIQGNLQDGSNVLELLAKLPETVTIIGGNLNTPHLSGYSLIDLLDNPFFLAKNAYITAECALQIASRNLHATLSDSPALILGWGRIGKHLSLLLKNANCNVTVAARKESDRAFLRSLGYRAIDFCDVPQNLSHIRLLFNTVPCQTVSASSLDQANSCVKIDLASYPGLVCNNIISARGLPGKLAPESAGKLIAESVLTILKEG